MSKRNATTKRTITRVIHNMANYSGTNSDIVLRAAADPVTLVRTIVQGLVLSATEGATSINIHLEIWRKSNAAGVVLPTFDLAGDVPYGDEDDLIWKGRYGLIRETTASNSYVPVNVDMKGNRKLSRSDDLVLRFAGASTIFIEGIITMFFKES